MTKYVRISGRIIVNAASLNTQGGAGTNYIELTKIPVVIKHGNYVLKEVPAISGNMIKRYHFVGFVDAFRNTKFKDNLTKEALRYVAYRFQEKMTKVESAGGNSVSLDDESTIIKNLADADLHGFLAPQTQVRRESLCKFSFFIPVEEAVADENYGIEAVTHNRVIIEETGAIAGRIEEAAAMMLFKRQYASAPFGFSIVLDLGLVGVPLANILKGSQISDEERVERSKAAILALSNLFTGKTGASTSRAFPAEKVEEIIAASCDAPTPALVHGFYRDYAEQSAKNLGAYVRLVKTSGNNLPVRVFIYARDNKRRDELKGIFEEELGKENVRVVESPIELLEALCKEIGS